MAYYTQNIKIFSHFGNFYFIQSNIFQFQKQNRISHSYTLDYIWVLSVVHAV